MLLLRSGLLGALVFVTSLPGQTAPQPSPQRSAPAQKSSQAPSPSKEDTHLSPAEAEELFKSMDDIMKFASDDSGLPIRSQVKRELDDRDKVVAYIRTKMEDDPDTKRFERTEVVLKKFGMLPVDFQLQPFLLKLMREQVAGFYDSKTKSMHLLDWLKADEQRPVMAHELTHALQDQMVDLENWTGALTDATGKAADPVNAEIENDEDSTARTALVEGQGTVVMADYMLLPLGKSLETAPELREVMKQSMNSTEGMPTLASAPILLRESLTFPYRDGLGFVTELLKAGGKKKAFADALKDPPHDTHQILHPQDYLDHKPTPMMHMPDLSAALGDAYEKYDVGSIGEFDLQILFEQFSDDRSTKELVPKWNGGMYYSAVRRAPKSGKTDAATPVASSDLALLYVSHWPTADGAARFAAAYGQTVTKRYGVTTHKDCVGVQQCSMWSTATGPVTVQSVGTTVIAIESFDEKTAEALRKVIVASSAAPAKNEATEIPAENLGLRVAAKFFAARRALIH